jgi:polyphosphate:AMP phosphotransferase
VFESAEIHQFVPKEAYEAEVPNLRAELIKCQIQLTGTQFPVIVVIAGNDRIACNQTLNLLHEWLDPRFIHSNTFDLSSEEESERPIFWRYWRRMPPRGSIGVFLGGWATRGLNARLEPECDANELRRWYAHVRQFEQCLTSDGAVILKFWLHLPKEQMRARFKEARKNPDEWSVDEDDQALFQHFDESRVHAEDLVRETSTENSQWHIVESTDIRSRNLKIGRVLLKALSKKLSRVKPVLDTETIEIARPGVEATRTVLDTVDLSLKLDRKEYRKLLAKAQADMFRVARRARDAGIASVVVFEGWDAGGKGGAIRRLTASLDASLYQVVPIAAPTEEERGQHYLWRFWRHLPRAGRMTIFDRSWYGRVLVERVESFAFSTEWRRAYPEIRDFEEQLVEAGIVLSKFWMHIDQDEQMRRFKEREETPHKKHKITEEDYRNRDQRRAYELAVHEMVERTSTRLASWTLVPANDKLFGRVHVIETHLKHLRSALGEDGPMPGGGVSH